MEKKTTIFSKNFTLHSNRHKWRFSLWKINLENEYKIFVTCQLNFSVKLQKV